jgi:hypothetical protein
MMDPTGRDLWNYAFVIQVVSDQYLTKAALTAGPALCKAVKLLYWGNKAGGGAVDVPEGIGLLLEDLKQLCEVVFGG